MITVGTLVAAGVGPTQARDMVQPLLVACLRFDINTSARVGAFVAQCMVETGHFTRFEENLYYTTPERIMRIFPTRVTSLQQASLLARKPELLANAVYAGKLGNGNPLTGDGWKYRGRGCIQLTGRSNYVDAATALARPYLEQPDLVAAPADACLTAAWFWHTNKLNLLADASAIDAITKAVNGPAMVEAALRKQRTAEAVMAFA